MVVAELLHRLATVRHVYNGCLVERRCTRTDGRHSGCMLPSRRRPLVRLCGTTVQC